MGPHASPGCVSMTVPGSGCSACTPPPFDSECAATPAAARDAKKSDVAKSPKDKKFSPRLTRAQRAEKAAKGKK